MKLLIDENLPIGLGRGLGLESIHATQLGRRLTDIQLWDEAKARDCVLVTKDADFFDRLSLFGPPPKVIWARFGNLRRKDVEALFVDRWPQITKLLRTSELLEVFADRIEGLSFP